MRRVLHVIDSLTIGGAEKLLVEVVNSMNGFEHHIISLSDKNDLEGEINNECKVLKLGFKSKKDIFRCVKKIRRYINENRIEIVHSHLVMANVIARLASPRNIKVFNSLHSLIGETHFSDRFSWQRVVEKCTYRSRHHLIAVSKHVLKDYQRHIGVKGKAEVLNNFVGDKFFAETYQKTDARNGLKMIAVGSLKPQKNYDFLLQAFKYLSESITLDIFGDGPLRSELEQTIDLYGINNVRLRGIGTHMEAKIKEYDLYVMSSIAEGHPIALLEAMALGMPVIISDIPVLREATGDFSLYFSLSNSKEFVNKITDIAEGKVDLNRYAEYNLAYAKKIGNKENYLIRLGNLYNSHL